MVLRERNTQETKEIWKRESIKMIRHDTLVVVRCMELIRGFHNHRGSKGHFYHPLLSPLLAGCHQLFLMWANIITTCQTVIRQEFLDRLSGFRYTDFGLCQRNLIMIEPK